MIWEAYQQKQISEAGQTPKRAEGKVESYVKDIDTAERHLDRLTLACQAMWELLRESSDLTESDLENKIIEVDLRDGKADGKISTKIMSCPSCGKNTNSKRSVCIMCGAPISKPHVFEA